jgi:hypothetical protein
MKKSEQQPEDVNIYVLLREIRNGGLLLILSFHQAKPASNVVVGGEAMSYVELHRIDQLLSLRRRCGSCLRAG